MRIDGPGLVRLLEQAASIEDFEEKVARHYFAGPDVRDVVSFLEIPGGPSFDVPPEQAIAFFKRKRLRPTFGYGDMLRQSHAQAFTVAKMMDVDLLGTVRASLDAALAAGTPYREWADTILPTLQSAGWWGRKEVVDPLTGQTIVAQLGSPSRLETIFRTNMQSAYAAGQWAEIQRNADVAPFLMYDAVDDFRTRELHRSWDQKVLPANSVWWQTHYPPNGYNCRCGVIQLDAEEVEALGLNVALEPPADGFVKWTNPRTGETMDVPAGVDPGFDYNVGKAYLDRISKTLDEKAAALPDSAAEAAKQAIADMRKQIALIAQVEAENQAASDVARAATLAAQARANATAEASIARAKAIAAEKAKQAAAQAQLDAIKTGKGGAGIYGKNAFNALAKIPGFASGQPTDQLDAVLAKAKQLAEAAAKTKALAGYEKAMIAGKAPTKAQLAAFDSLPDADKAPIFTKIEAEKAKIAAAKAAEAQAQAQAAAKAADAQSTPKAAAVLNEGAPPDGRRLVQVGPQKGSNEGGEFLDQSTGIRWYVKYPTSEDIARNEVLAAKLYELAGIDVPELHLIDVNGRKAIASRIVDGVRKARPDELAVAAGTADGFAVDAWLANWDTVGLGYDNLLLRAGRAIRIDVGGSLRYRAQGTLKGAAFDDAVSELESLRRPVPNIDNSQVVAVFGKLTPSQIEDSVARVLRLDEGDIRAIVERFGPLNEKTRRDLADLLIARRATIARRYPDVAARVAARTAPEPEVDVGRVTAIEQKAIEAGRSNGYAILTDGADIEDHNVVVSTATRADGSKLTRAWMKLRPDAQARLMAAIGQAAGKAPEIQLAKVRDSVVTWLRGINKRADDGANVETKDLERARAARDELQAAIAKITAAEADADVASYALLTQRGLYLSQLLDATEAFLASVKVGDKAARPLGSLIVKESDVPNVLTWRERAKAPQAGVSWKKASGFEYEVARFDRGRATFTGSTSRPPLVSQSFETTLPGGVRVRFIPADGNSGAPALHGILQIDVDGISVEASKRAFAALSEIGVDSRRVTDTDRAHYYLNAVARTLLTRAAGRLAAWSTWKSKFLGLNDAASIEKKLEFLSRETGVDVKASRGWQQRAGVYQAFGHGRVHIMRPDLDTTQFDALERDTYLFHNPSGNLSKVDSGPNVWQKVKIIVEAGGQFASASDRIRRGVPLSKHNEEDIVTGGGDFLFTRIKSRSDTMGTGIYWRLRQIKRLDAITYDSDYFGRTTGDFIEGNRLGHSVDSIRAQTSRRADETNFKGGMSIFDDVEYIVLSTKAEVDAAIRDMRAWGYQEWPDGRRLDEVIVVKATRGRAKP